MALQPFRFDPIPRANIAGALQAGANVGAQQQRNRMAELTMQRDQQDRQAQAQRVSREDKANALRQAAAAYQLAAQQQDPAQRDAIIAGYRQNMERIYGPEAVEDFSPVFDQKEFDALQAFMPQQEAPKMPAAVQTAQWLAGEATPEQKRAFMEAKRAGASSVTVNGQPFELRDTPQGLAAISVNPETGEAEVKVVAEKPTTAETEIERAAGRREAGEAPLKDALTDYRTAVEGASTVGGIVPPGAQREALNQRRRALVAMVAKNILGTPGAEPSPSLYAQAEELVPDYSGAFDRSNFGTMIDTLESMLAEAETTPLPDEPGPTRVPVEGDVARIASDAEYDALPSGARFVGPDGVMREKP